MTQVPELHIILGLGNPGAEYAATKHNVGWMVIDELAQRHGIELRRERLKANYGRGRIAGHAVVLAKPLTFVNLSGDAALRLAFFFRVKVHNFLVVLDDMNLPPGTLRLRASGSDGGHKGLRSIIETFGTTEVPRLRVGIGPPQEGDAVQWVLSPFDENTQPIMAAAIKTAADCVETYLAEGLEVAMQRYNG
ncbi:MAG: aminoacyl-tRNA hydrolase [Armatimonadetes bacterium]|nr:aminoacyl-tRNA hydrolase [Armatimonadota bacterium]